MHLARLTHVLVWTAPITSGLLALACVALSASLFALGYYLAIRKATANLASLRAQAEAIDRSQMIIEMAMDATILNVNSNYTRNMGYAPEEVIGKHASMLIPEEDLRSGSYDLFWAALRRGEFQSGQFKRLKKNGEAIWIEANYNPILDAQGVPIKIVGLLSDVTPRILMEQERDRQEEALRKSEQFLEETGGLAGVGGWEVDLISGTVTWLPETYRLLAAPPSYHPTLEAALDLYTQESRPLIAKAVEQARIDGTGWDLQLSLRRMDGKLIWTRVVGRARLLNGKPVALFGAFQDITDRIEERNVLQWATQRAELATASGGIGIWEWNLEKNTLVCDAQMYRILHLPLEDRKETDFSTWSRLLHPDDMERVEKHLRDAVDGVRPYETEYRIVLEANVHFIRATGQVSRDRDGLAFRMVGTIADITASVMEKSALEDANERIALATESGGIGIWEWDILEDKMILDQRVMRLYDLKTYAYHPITCRTWMQYLHPEDQEAAWQDLQDGLKDKRQFDSWFRIMREDGGIRYVRTTGKIIRDSAGRPVRMLGTNLDMTDRRQAEDALRDQASLLDLCHDAIIVRNLDGTIRFWNHGAQEIYGFSRMQAVGKVSHRLLDTVFPAPLEEIDRTFLEKERWEGELNHITKSGRRVIVDSRWAMKRDDSGRPIAVMEINSDVTERKQAEEALRQSTEKEQLLLHGVKDFAIIMLDPQGNVATWNEGGERIKGYKAEEIVGRHVSAFYPPEAVSAGKPQLVIEEARSSGRFEETGWRVRKDGTRFWANVVITALRDTSGKLRGFGKVTRDITDRKLAEEATEKARAAADQANRAKSDFLANMSHEVRTPVNAIMGMAYLALRANPEKRQREYLLKIDTAAQRLLSTINDILDFSKIEAGKLKLERIDFALSEVMQNLRDIVEHKAREKHLSLTFSIGPGVPSCLAGDPLRLGQVLINLVNNAVKFTEHGEVRVCVALDPGPDPPMLRFIVSDTGIGMTALQMENLFQAFHQADTSFTRQYGGTGLGLAISKQLVELMGGRITIESQFGEGSTFSFTIPLATGSSLVSVPSRPPSHRATKVLIVDDNENTRDELVQLLRHHGQHAYATTSGEEALTLLTDAAKKGDPFGLVVMDWRLPGMNGVEASRRIRQNLVLQPTPIIIMISAFDRHDVAPAGEEVTFDEFLLKPVKEESFLQAVWSLLDAKPATNQPSVPSDGTSLAGRHILLVEDNDLNRDLATELLADLGVRVTVAVDGQAAVDAVLKQTFDLVLMDIQMPVMDGLTATTRIRTDPRFAQLPIVAMTAHAMTGDYERSLAAGMNDHITKPIDPRVLTTTLLRWLPSNGQWAVPDHLGPFHLSAALIRTNNKPKLLRKLLLGFRQQYAEAGMNMKALLANENWPEAQRYAHSLKGIAATLEARELSEAAAALETALHQGHTTNLTPLVTQLDAALKPAITAVSTL